MVKVFSIRCLHQLLFNKFTSQSQKGSSDLRTKFATEYLLCFVQNGTIIKIILTSEVYMDVTNSLLEEYIHNPEY